MANSLQLSTDKEARMVSLSGFDLINTPRLNKGTAFTDHERDALPYMAYCRRT